MTKIIEFSNKINEKEKLILMTPDEFKDFIEEYKDDPNLKDLIKEYIKLDENLQAGFARNTMLYNNNAINEDMARENIGLYFQLGKDLARLQDKIIETYLNKKTSK